MNFLASLRQDKEWDIEIGRIEKTPLHRNEVQKLYAEGKLRNGEIVSVHGAMLQRYLSGEETEGWCLGMMLHGKFLYVVHSKTDRRLKRLKRQAYARLLEIAKTGMVDTRQSTMLPPRYQSLKNPDFVLYGANSRDTDLESPTMSETPKIFDEREEIAHPGLEK